MSYLVVIDGVDGSGKHTQASLLNEKLNGLGIKARLMSFPRYESKSSELIKMYLNGEIKKDASEVNPYAASMMFAADRYIGFKQEWEDWYNEYEVLVSDRYTTANIIHQGVKFETLQERKEFYNWVKETEHKLMKIPEENMTILLMVDPKISFELIKKRSDECDRKVDIHENMEYMRKSYETAKEASEILGWNTVDCVKYGTNELRSKEDIAEEIEKLVIGGLTAR